MKRYMNEFIGLKCAADLLRLGLFPNAKEITESMGAFHAFGNVLMGYTQVGFSDGVTKIICVGDGHTPRTGALFAFRTGLECISIDPNLKMSSYPIERLTVYQKKIEDVGIDCDRCVIVLVHSHAPMEAILSNIKATERHIIAIPCCVPYSIPNKVYMGYTDTNIWSPRNEVKIWMNV